MGGFGSGRREGHRPRNTTDDARAIDVRRWQQEKLLTCPYFEVKWIRLGHAIASMTVRPETDRVYLILRNRISPDEWTIVRLCVRLDWTPCHYGGQRAWFLCAHCNRRAAVLYGSATIACRQCLGLAYTSTRENKARRAGRRAEKIRARLKWRPGIAWGTDLKPRFMHWKTFDRLSAQVADLATIASEGALRRIGLDPDF